jgi:CPA2 family monovalent cation:H+ antiporter-2
MPHDTPLTTTIVAALTLAWALAGVAHRLKLPPLVGYLVAGIVIGPFTPGYVADQNLAGQLAEIGVILLMFGVGLHFSLDDLLSVKTIAIPGPSRRFCARRCSAWGLRPGSAGRRVPGSCSDLRFRWRAPSFCSARCRSGG